MQENTENTLPDAPLWRRLAAMIYDSLLLFGLSMGYGFAVVAIAAGLRGKDAIEHSATAAGNPLVFAGWIVLVGGFFCVFWLRNRQTLGMQAWRLQIQTVEGDPLTLRHCLARLAGACLSWSAMGLGYFWCLLPSHNTWHDRLSHTRITVHPKRP